MFDSLSAVTETEERAMDWAHSVYQLINREGFNEIYLQLHLDAMLFISSGIWETVSYLGLIDKLITLLP